MLARPVLGMHPELGELPRGHRRRQQAGRCQAPSEQQEGMSGFGNQPKQQRIEYVQGEDLCAPGLQLRPDLTNPDVGEHGRPPPAAITATSDGPADARMILGRRPAGAE